MTAVELIEERAKIGKPILATLFDMTAKELKAYTKELLGDKVQWDILDGHVTKTSLDDEPYEIEIRHWDVITISWIGIHSKPEHGKIVTIVEFDKHFKL